MKRTPQLGLTCLNEPPRSSNSVQSESYQQKPCDLASGQADPLKPTGPPELALTSAGATDAM